MVRTLAYTGNRMPKTLTPLDRLSCDPARAQAFQRLSGLIWLLAGLTFAAAWIVLPLGAAAPLSMLAVACAMAVTISQIARAKFS